MFVVMEFFIVGTGVGARLPRFPFHLATERQRSGCRAGKYVEHMREEFGANHNRVHSRRGKKRPPIPEENTSRDKSAGFLMQCCQWHFFFTLVAIAKPRVSITRACKETRRAKAKVWNLRDLERARCIPPPPLATGATNGGGKVSTAIRRLSVASAARRKFSMKGQTQAANKAHTENFAAGEGSESNKEVAVDGKGVVEDKEAELERRREEREAQALAK